MIVIASRNEGKVREIAVLPAASGLELRPVSDFPGCPDIEENGTTCEENAVIKAVKYSLWLRREHGIAPAVISEDSGLMVFSLLGWPGVHSARIAETDVERNWMVLDRLSGQRDRSAQFLAYTALAVNGVLVESWRGSVTGVIAEEPRGNQGFGYDPIFIDQASGRSFAELDRSRKNELSHRNQAWTQAFEYLRQHSLGLR
ncbi:non-canonical purine NTP pyrophosphatase [bacterium]|nr:non-canonical purine NTP pyrophosphatase [bacterium]